MSWIGPRRAMLFVALLCTLVGWAYKDEYTLIFGEPATSIGGLLIFASVVFILAVIFYSVINTC